MRNEPHHEDEDAADLLEEVRKLLNDGHLKEGPDVATPTDRTPFQSPITRGENLRENLRENLSEQQTDDCCQTTFAAQLGSEEGTVFEYADGFFCRQNLREPVILPTTRRSRVLKLSHHKPLPEHRGRTRLKHRLRRVYYSPQMAADIGTVVSMRTPCRKCSSGC